MQTSSQTKFSARIRGICSGRLSARSESILVFFALIMGRRSETLPQRSKDSRTIPMPTSAARRSHSIGFAEHCSNSVFHEIRSVQRRLYANCCRVEIVVGEWLQMRDHLGLELPGLVLPRCALFLALFGPATILICMKVFWGIPLSVASILFLSVVLVLPALFTSIPLARTLPPGCNTCGGLAERILARNYAAFAIKNGSLRGAEVLWTLRQLVATEMVMNIEEVSPDTRISQDLDIY